MNYFTFLAEKRISLEYLS